MKIVALDVGGTAIKSAYAIDSHIEKTFELPSEAKKGASILLKNIFKSIEMHKPSDVISISTTGQVDSDKGTIVYANENVPGYTGTNLKQILMDRYQIPVHIENDVNAAAIGEGFVGAAKSEKDFLCLTYGTGVGGAIVINKEVDKGSCGVAGEMGHIITHPNGRLCGCGQKGCYEQYASTTALVRSAMAISSSYTNGRIIFENLSKGNDSLKEVIDCWIDEILYGLVSLIHIFNPSCIVLGGGIMQQSYVFNEIKRKIQTRIMSSYSNINIISAQLGNNAGLYGMIAIANQ